MNKEELFSKIWKTAETLRGSVDSWEFKSVTLSVLYLKFTSLKTGKEINLQNLKEVINEYFVQTRLNDEQLQKVIDGIDELGDSFGNIDILGDAYEYLMGMYASSAGKSGGEFFTPQCVSELLTLLTAKEKEIESAYDPTCGSGSLLLQVNKNCKVKNLYGQEINSTSYNICKLNMMLHDIKNFDIQNADTLIEPKHLGQKFDVIVSNPPYSIKWEGKKNPHLINDIRYKDAGVLAPSSKADWAFILHSLHHLKDTGRMGVVVFPGILYRTGAETTIRKYLVDNNLIETIISIPSNLFYHTAISTTIILLTKDRKDDKILFVDASEEFVKEGKRNKIIKDKILDICTKRVNVDDIASVVDKEKIASENYNLSVNTYVQKKDTREEIDIDKLNEEVRRIHQRKIELYKQWDEMIIELEKEIGK